MLLVLGRSPGGSALYKYASKTDIKNLYSEYWKENFSTKGLAYER